MTDAERAAIIEEAYEADEPIESDDPVVLAAARLLDYYGAWRDPVLSPEGAVEVASVALNARSRP